MEEEAKRAENGGAEVWRCRKVVEIKTATNTAREEKRKQQYGGVWNNRKRRTEAKIRLEVEGRGGEGAMSGTMSGTMSGAMSDAMSRVMSGANSREQTAGSKQTGDTGRGTSRDKEAGYPHTKKVGRGLPSSRILFRPIRPILSLYNPAVVEQNPGHHRSNPYRHGPRSDPHRLGTQGHDRSASLSTAGSSPDLRPPRISGPGC